MISLNATYACNIQQALVEEYAAAPGMFLELARIESMLAETYRNRVQYELLQNSDDAESSLVVLEACDSTSFTWKNDGRVFTTEDFESLCRSASSNKKRGESIGYRGIGFKSLASIANEIKVLTGGMSFCFNAEKAKKLIAEKLEISDLGDVPLIRIPAEIKTVIDRGMVEFHVESEFPLSASTYEIDPISLLFLRNVNEIRIHTLDEERLYARVPGDKEVILTLDDRQARFLVLSGINDTKLAIPLNDEAFSLTGSRGKVCAFLPLNEELGLPFIVSGHLMTDPSRTNLVLNDDSKSVLDEAAGILASLLLGTDPENKFKIWELLLQGEDLRALLAYKADSAAGYFVHALKEKVAGKDTGIIFVPIEMDDKDVKCIFGSTVPVSLYSAENASKLKAAKVVFGLPEANLGELVYPYLSQLSKTTLNRAIEYTQMLIKTLGTEPSERECALFRYGESIGSLIKKDTESKISIVRQPHENELRTYIPFPEVARRWRNAETAVLEWLNARGWQLKDVSKQNLGYDLEGIDSDGQRVLLEIKRVQGMNHPFSMTNNEMGAASLETDSYYVALVVGADSNPQLALLRPSDERIQIDRVCRAWEWQFNDWSRAAELLE